MILVPVDKIYRQIAKFKNNLVEKNTDAASKRSEQKKSFEK